MRKLGEQKKSDSMKFCAKKRGVFSKLEWKDSKLGAQSMRKKCKNLTGKDREGWPAEVR